jgi:hypothetical protein
MAQFERQRGGAAIAGVAGHGGGAAST